MPRLPAARRVGSDLGQLALPLLVIVGGSALFRALFQRLRQPGVLGELALGMLLGASLLRWAWPAGEAALFPASAMPGLEALSGLGLALFMFAVGSEMRWQRGDGAAAAKLAGGALLLPFALGALLAAARPGWFFDGAPGLRQVALVAVVMCVSALPVLARILEHHALLDTRLGALALGAGTLDDLFAWGMLALLLGDAPGLTGGFLPDAAIVAAVFGGALLADRALARGLARAPTRALAGRARPGPALLALLVCAVLGSSWLTQAAGLHGLLGPLLVGALASRHPALRDYARGKLHGLTTALLLPVFFVLAGRGMDATLLASAGGLVMLGAVLAVASLGKLLGCWLGGHAAGLRAEERVAAGLLLNARGAVGLVVAQAAYDAGLLAPRGLALLALTIVATTLMAGPLLAAFARWNVRRTARPGPAARQAVPARAR